MITDFPIVPLEKALKQRSNFIEIDDLATYKRCRVQLHAQGIIERDSIQGTEIKTKRQQICRAGEFLVAEIDAKVGGFGIVPDKLNGAIVSSHYFLFELDETVLMQHFLEFFIRTPAFIEQVRAQGTTNYAAIRPSDVLGYKIPLPPLEEQHRIISRIEELAGRIEEAKGLRGEAVEGTERLMPIITESIFGELDTRSERHSLRETAKIFGGGTPSKANYSFWQGTIPWVSPKDMKIREIYDTEDHISEEVLQAGISTLIPQNSVLIVVRSGILRRTLPIAINRVPVTINQDMKALIPSENLLCDFLAWWFKGKESRFLEIVKGGTTVQSVMWDKATEFNICVPSLNEQRQVVSHLDSLQAKVDALKQLQSETSAELNALLPSILDKAFKGEL